MVLTATFEEEYKDRSISVSRDDFQQEFSFIINGNFIEEANVDPTYGPDDDQEALKYAYSIVPPSRTMPLYEGGDFLILLQSIELEQLDNNTWRATVVYAPDEEDEGGGGGGGAPNVIGENWSQDFVQININITPQMEKINRSLEVMESVKRVGSAGNPLTVGQPGFIGLSNAGVEGTQKFARKFEFGITGYFAPSKLTFPYIRRLYRMSTTVNSEVFFGFPAFSCLFTGFTADGNRFQRIPVGFEFQMRPNFRYSEAGPEQFMDPTEDDPANMYDTYFDPFFPSSTITHSGWAEVDYRYGPKVSQGVQIQSPISRSIHRIYGASNYALFNL